MGPGNAQARRPFPQFSNVTWINPSIGNSTYHGGFVRAEKRFSGGFSLLAHYTFSKFIDDVESANEYGITGSYMDAYNRRLDKGLSGSDVPHHLVSRCSMSFRSCSGNRLAEERIGRLEARLAGNRRIRRAVHRDHHRQHDQRLPRRLTTTEPAARSVAVRRPASITHWFDTSAFAAPAQFTFGNSPRSGLRGAPVVTTDVTLEKSLRLNEKIQFRSTRRVLQHPEPCQFQCSGSHLRRGGFRLVTSARAGRVVQLAGRLSF